MPALLATDSKKRRALIPPVAGRADFKQFLELPIQVEHAIDAYPIVDAALEQLEGGQFQQAAMLADALFTDDRVTACISTRINAVLGLEKEFKWQGQEDEQAGDVDSSDEIIALKKTICDLSKKKFEEMVPAAALQQMMRGGIQLNAGFCELVWTWGEDGLLYPTMKSWNSQFLYWRWDTRSFWIITQGGTTELWPGDGRWVLFSPGGHNHGWLYGLIRAAAFLWLDRRFAFRDWARASEKWSLGLIEANVPADASDHDKETFAAAVSDLPSEGVVICPVTPSGAKFGLTVVKTDSMTGWESFEKRITNLNGAIAVLYLGQNLSTEISGSSGSKAAAKVHDNVRADYLKADVEILASTLRKQLFGPWVKYNWGGEALRLGVPWQDLVPLITWKAEPAEDKQESTMAVANIASAVQALAGTDLDVRALLTQHQIPVVEQRTEQGDPPPSGATERPRAPGGIVEEPEAYGAGDDNDDQRPDLAGSPAEADNSQPVERKPEQLSLLSAKRAPPNPKRPKGLKRGARRGQLYIDDAADQVAKEASEAFAARRKQLLEICSSSKSYEEVRARVKDLYRGLSSRRIREITAHAMITAELVGHISAREDRDA